MNEKTDNGHSPNPAKPTSSDISSRVRTMVRLRRAVGIPAYIESLPGGGSWQNWYLALTAMGAAAKTRQDAARWGYFFDEFAPAMPTRCTCDLMAAQRAMLQRIATAEAVGKDGVAALAKRPREPLCPRARTVLDNRIDVMKAMGCDLELSLACEAILLRHDDDRHLDELRRFLAQAFEDLFRRGDGGVRLCKASVMLTDLRRIARRAGLRAPPWT